MLDLGTLRGEARARLGEKRLSHVASVAETARRIAEKGGWSAEVRDAVLRAAWIHDAWKEADLAAWKRVIGSAGWEPDSWALAHAPHLLHADAAAAWARVEGEPDEAVVEAVRYHPTAHPEWGPLGRILFVADFCEPMRDYADALGTGAILSRAAEGREGLEDAALRVLETRLAWMEEHGRPVHPRSRESWNAWRGEAPDVRGAR